MTTTTMTMTATPEAPEISVRTATGVLDIGANGAGHLRAAGLLPTSHDVQVPAALVRRFGLRKGDLVAGLCARPHTLTHVDTVDGAPADAVRSRPRFGDLTPLHPAERLRMESPASGLGGRVVD
ncbi:hypothetical protein ACFWDZ_33280, partial [Micromonospora aurantiaca]